MQTNIRPRLSRKCEDWSMLTYLIFTLICGFSVVLGIAFLLTGIDMYHKDQLELDRQEEALKSCPRVLNITGVQCMELGERTKKYYSEYYNTDNYFGKLIDLCREYTTEIVSIVSCTNLFSGFRYTENSELSSYTDYKIGFYMLVIIVPVSFLICVVSCFLPWIVSCLVTYVSCCAISCTVSYCKSCTKSCLKSFCKSCLKFLKSLKSCLTICTKNKDASNNMSELSEQEYSEGLECGNEYREHKDNEP